MLGREGLESPQGLQTLSFGCNRPVAAALVRRDDDVHEPLEKVSFAGVARTPRELECLVRLEEVAGPCKPHSTLVFG
jgi:hypothetical protein